ncbi:hypothetical protein CFC21_045280 [Triticum aestivum]|uniref:F-box protein AT5G49610-like beta-propeller domain-containing protein n=2 Tax=Triticum aestivum TaxID=4565 RepID=A0A9R1JYE6_WHEAT|nr:uncharacterized protein LOC123076784 [Triticum aestivum]XP_044354845.1 uncharacterized protein LOC123076784 [Triticum aestivum]KAF7034240.1 hypothetical protein CFC21_045280 [Triticum aestivum]
MFKPVLDPPDCVPPQRFDMRLHDIDSSRGMGVQLPGCRHGRLLIMSSRREELIVIAPITGEKLHLTVPSKFKGDCYLDGAVLCAATDHDHVHGSCHLSPFKVVLLSLSIRGPQPAFAHVYSSETGVWSDLISTPTPPKFCHTNSPGSLIGNALYWLCRGADYILKFDFDGRSLAVIRAPPITNDVCYRNGSHQIIQAVDGAVGLAILSHNSHTIQMWQKEVNSQSVNKWFLWQTIEMHNIHGLPAQIEGQKARLIFILGYAEDTDGILLYMDGGVYMVQLKLMQPRKLCEKPPNNHYHSFESFYMPDSLLSFHAYTSTHIH